MSAVASKAPAMVGYYFERGADLIAASTVAVTAGSWFSPEIRDALNSFNGDLALLLPTVAFLWTAIQIVRTVGGWLWQIYNRRKDRGDT